MTDPETMKSVRNRALATFRRHHARKRHLRAGVACVAVACVLVMSWRFLREGDPHPGAPAVVGHLPQEEILSPQTEEVSAEEWVALFEEGEPFWAEVDGKPMLVFSNRNARRDHLTQY